MFKRREAKKADIGHIVSINRNVVERMSRSLDYTNNSASLYAETNMNTIQFRSLRGLGQKVFAADITLLYIKKESLFGNGLVEVVPLAVNKDNRRGDVVKSLISKKVKYLMHKDSLALVSDVDILTRTEHMGDHALNFIKNQLQHRYGINGFVWGNK